VAPLSSSRSWRDCGGGGTEEDEEEEEKEGVFKAKAVNEGREQAEGREEREVVQAEKQEEVVVDLEVERRRKEDRE
jgi:hypothetical protein